MEGEMEESKLEPTGVETARVELARVRARFGLDPEIPSQLFADAWTSPSGVVEEDEAEFVDAMADCMSAGLPLGAAIMFWASGALAGGADDDGGEDDDEESCEVEINP
jgi:hypothetical protein